MLAVLHPGAMGAAVPACLVGRGHQVGWPRTGRSEQSMKRADKAGLTPFDDLSELLTHADVVFRSARRAQRLRSPNSWWAFTGSWWTPTLLAPMTSRLVGRTVTAGGARYVDGGISGPPPLTARTTRLYLAGDNGEVASLLVGSALDVVSLAGAPPAASALKMTYGAWTKTTAALLISIRRTAAAFGVEDDLTKEWEISQPDLPVAWLRARQQSDQKGWRWSYELAEVGRTFAAVGEPEGFGAAASQTFAASVDERPPADSAEPN
jgi:3-hydroxyisobutyrate dehydrogenase-like beta-hydroxyacid dehydrogenase